MTNSLDEIISILSGKLVGFPEALENERVGFDSWSCLPPARYKEKDVLDLGCGIGAAVSLFIQRGANLVWGIDPVLTEEQINILSILPKSRFTSGLLSREPFGDQRFDIVYARFASEHVIDLSGTFGTVFDLLKPGGRFVALHGNYYSPMGAHDFPFMGLVSPGEYTCFSKAVPCWKSPKKCEVSTEFRKELEQKYDWSVSTWTLTPHDCSQCAYFRRAQLWGHLLHQDKFNQDYQGAFYKTNPDGSLNKVTPFQLKQFMIEAGFKVTTWEEVIITNHPPRELLERLSERDLRTLNILFAADKPAG